MQPPLVPQFSSSIQHYPCILTISSNVLHTHITQFPLISPGRLILPFRVGQALTGATDPPAAHSAAREKSRVGTTRPTDPRHRSRLTKKTKSTSRRPVGSPFHPHVQQLPRWGADHTAQPPSPVAGSSRTAFKRFQARALLEECDRINDTNDTIMHTVTHDELYTRKRPTDASFACTRAQPIGARVRPLDPFPVIPAFPQAPGACGTGVPREAPWTCTWLAHGHPTAASNARSVGGVEQRLSSPRPAPRGPAVASLALPHAHGTGGAGGSR